MNESEGQANDDLEKATKDLEEATKDLEEATKKRDEKLWKSCLRQLNERSYLIPRGTIEQGKPPRKQPTSLVDRMICDTGVPHMEWRDSPSLGNDHFLPSEIRDTSAPAYNTRGRVCICPQVRTDCDDIIQEIQQITDEILDDDILCSGGIRQNLVDFHDNLRIVRYFQKGRFDELPDPQLRFQWSLAFNKVCKAFKHKKRNIKKKK